MAVLASIIDRLLGSRPAMSACLIALPLLITIGVVLAVGYVSVRGKCDILQKDLDTVRGEVVDLSRQVEERDLEIRYLKKGQSLSDKYVSEERKALEDERETREEALRSVLQDSDIEDWWNTPIPDNIADLLTCH